MSAEPPSVVVATLGGFFGTINRKDTWIRFAAPGVLSLCVWQSTFSLTASFYTEGYHVIGGLTIVVYTKIPRITQNF